MIDFHNVRNSSRVALIALLMVAGLSLQASAQNRGPAGPPPPGRGPGGPGGPGAPGGPPSGGPGNGPAGANSGAAGNGTASSPAHVNALQVGPVGRWWDDKSVVKTLGLSSAQQQKMDSIFNANKPVVLASYRSLETEKAKLAAMTKQADANQAAVSAQIDAVGRARTELQKNTTLMLLKIRDQMNDAQVAKLGTLQ